MAFSSDFTSEEKDQLSHCRRFLDEVDEIARGFILDADDGNNSELGYFVGNELHKIKWCSKAVFSPQHWDKVFSIINRSVNLARELQVSDPSFIEFRDIEVKLTLAYRGMRLVELDTYRSAS